MKETRLSIDIVSDTVCPWCVIGYRNLQQALRDLAPDISAEIRWRPFQLNPDIPPEGESLFEHIRKKYGSSETESRAMRERITALGAESGFEFRFTDNFRTWNTFDTHRALLWAADQGRETELQEALFTAYFTQGENPGDPEVLVREAANVGLAADDLREVLSSDRYRAETVAALQEVQQLGITGVPNFIINQRYSISGGQPVAAFRDMLTRLADEVA